jgi:hypothetical protein
MIITRRSSRQLVLFGLVAGTVLGIVLAPDIFGVRDPARAVIYGVGIGLVAAFGVYILLAWLRWRPRR